MIASSPRWSSARANLKVGNGMEAGIDIGPCVDQAQMETSAEVHRILARKESGVEPLCGWQSA